MDPHTADTSGPGAAGTGGEDDPGLLTASPRADGAQLRHVAGPAAAGTAAATASPTWSRPTSSCATEYIAEFNDKFAVAAAQKGSAFVRTARKDLDWIFSVQHGAHRRSRQHCRVGQPGFPDREDALAQYAWPAERDRSRTSRRSRVDPLWSAPDCAIRAELNCRRKRSRRRHSTSSTGQSAKRRPNKQGRRSFIQSGGSASRPPGFNALGQNCWIGSKR